jgi:hypothetical protein
MFWTMELAFRITPKSGPVRAMNTLLDASRAITQDLPIGHIKRQHWRDAGWAVFKAGDSGGSPDIRTATELLVQAMTSEGWMHRDARSFRAERLQEYLNAMETPLRHCMAVPVSRGRPKLTVIAGSRAPITATGESTVTTESLRRAS